MPMPDLADNHREERILRLEVGVQEVKTSLAEQGIKVGYMSQQIEGLTEKVEDTRNELRTQLEDFETRMSNKMDVALSKFDQVTATASAQEHRIAVLEISEKNRKKRWGRIRSIITAIIVAAAGAGATEIVNRLIHVPPGK